VKGKLLPLSALAKQWGWSVSKLHRLVAARQIPHIRVGKRRDVFFEEQELERWLAKLRVEQRDDARRATAPAANRRDLDAELAAWGLSREDTLLHHQ
jgi:predicted DNA-binding transcriptional regulator AlpA